MRHIALALMLAVAAASLGARAVAAAEAPRAFTPEQEQAIRALVRDYLVKNPEVLVEAMQELQERQRAAEKEQVAKALTANRSALRNDPGSPVAGNPKGDVTVVEFFDYRCGYCKSVADRVFETVKADGNVRLVFKEFPILGPESVFAAKAALAARNQNKYVPFHQALMSARGALNEDAVMNIAKKVGLDTARLREDMDGPAVARILEGNFKLAEALSIQGTPAFVVGDRMVPGAVNTETLKSLIAAARKSE